MSESPITLEKLLRLKRSELPEAVFWKEFEERMEKRRLKALIAPRAFPFWVALFRWLALAGVSGVGLTYAVWILGLNVQTPAMPVATEATLVAENHRAEPVIEQDLPEIIEEPVELAMAPAVMEYEPADWAGMTARFANDALPLRLDSAAHFRKILPTPDLVSDEDSFIFASEVLTTHGGMTQPVSYRAQQPF
jgi:hypothetical protein